MSTAEVTEVGPCKHRFRISVDADEIETAWKKTLEEVSGTVALPGFRKGKVPRKMIENRFAKELEAQVTENLVGEHFEKAVKDKDLAPLSDPAIEDLEFDRKDGLHFSATVEVAPSFELKKKDYTKVKLDKPPVDITDKDVDDALDNLRGQRARLETSDKAAKEGDHLTGSVTVTVGDETVLEREHAHLHAGHDHLAELRVEGLGKELVGKKAGDEVVHSGKLGDDFPEEAHRGADGTWTIKVSEVKVEVLPEVDEEFVKGFGVDSVDDLKERIREELVSTAENEARETMSEQLMDTIAKPLDLPVPEDLLRRQSLNLVRQGEAIYRIAAKPQDEQEAALEQEIEAVKEMASTQVRNYFILMKIAENEKIFVTEREVAQQISIMAMQRGMEPEAMMNELREKGGLTEVRLGLRERKTVEWLLDKADVRDGGKKKSTAKKSSDKKSSSKKKGKAAADES